MSKRNLLNLSLFIFTLALVILVIYEPGKKTPKTIPKLTALEVNDVHSIKIIRTNAKPLEKILEFEKTSAGWMMFKPYKLSANDFRIDSILKILSTESLSQNDLKDLNKDTFGLTKPVATITFNNDTSILFGNNKSLKHYRYVELDSMLHMVIDTFYYQLIAKAESYINHKLLHNKSKIVKLSLPNLLLKNTEGKWTVTPHSKSDSADSINQLIDEWQYSQAYDINIVKNKRKFRPDISIYLKNKQTINFKIEESKESFNLINTDTNVRYILSADRKNKLLKLSGINQTNE